MQKWEYCTVGPITEHYGQPLADLASRNYLNAEGAQAKVKLITDNLFLVISKLGEEGWEMVGCGNVGDKQHLIYFKRPKE